MKQSNNFSTNEEYYNALKKAANKSWKVELENIPTKDNEDADYVIDYELKARSERAYIKIAETIVEVSQSQLCQQNNSKNILKRKFTSFFIKFVSVQFLVLVFLLISKAFYKEFYLSEAVIITYMTSVFIETLGAIVLMIKYAYDSAQEVEILKILNTVISSYKKFNDK